MNLWIKKWCFVDIYAVCFFFQSLHNENIERKVSKFVIARQFWNLPLHLGTGFRFCKNWPKTGFFRLWIKPACKRYFLCTNPQVEFIGEIKLHPCFLAMMFLLLPINQSSQTFLWFFREKFFSFRSRPIFMAKMLIQKGSNLSRNCYPLLSNHLHFITFLCDHFIMSIGQLNVLDPLKIPAGFANCWF